MALKSLREGASSGFLKIILMGFMTLAVGGLVMTDVGGFFRGGVPATDVAKAGDQTISATSFDRLARQEAQNYGLTPQQAFQFGLINQTLARQIRASILHQEARSLGIWVGNDYIAQKIKEMVLPYAADHPEDISPQDLFEQTLRAQGTTEAAFIARLEHEFSAQTLLSALEAATPELSQRLLEDLYSARNETRDFEIRAFKHSDMRVDAEPTDDALQAVYEQTKEAYTIPESRDITILTLNLEAAIEGVSVSEEEILQTYDDNPDLFTVPEKRRLIQTIVSTQEQAQDIYNAVLAGSELQQGSLDITGNDSHFVPETSFEEDGMIEALRVPVFDAGGNTVLEPVKTTLGWHVIELVGIDSEYLEPLENVRENIETELLEQKKEDAFFDMIAAFDDMILDEEDFNVIQSALPSKTQSYSDLTAQTGLDDFSEKDRTKLRTQIFSLDEGGQSQVLEIENGDVIAIRVDAVTPRSFKPLDDVKENVRTDWIANEQRRLNREAALEALKAIQGNETTFNQIGGERIVFSEAPLNEDIEVIPFAALQNIFQTAIGTYSIVNTGDGFGIVHITGQDFPDAKDEDLSGLRTEILSQTRQDNVGLYLESKRGKYNPKINQPLLERMYGANSENF